MNTNEAEALILSHADTFRELLGKGDALAEWFYPHTSEWIHLYHKAGVWMEAESGGPRSGVYGPLAISAFTDAWRVLLEEKYGVLFYLSASHSPPQWYSFNGAVLFARGAFVAHAGERAAMFPSMLHAICAVAEALVKEKRAEAEQAAEPEPHFSDFRRKGGGKAFRAHQWWEGQDESGFEANGRIRSADMKRYARAATWYAFPSNGIWSFTDEHGIYRQMSDADFRADFEPLHPERRKWQKLADSLNADILPDGSRSSSPTEEASKHLVFAGGRWYVKDRDEDEALEEWSDVVIRTSPTPPQPSEAALRASDRYLATTAPAESKARLARVIQEALDKEAGQ